MISTKSPYTFLKLEFKKVVDSIYVDPNEKYIDIGDGQLIKTYQLNFHVEMLFYLILSQYFKKVLIKFGGEFKDLRMSLFLILGSRMGKGQLIKVVEEIGVNLGLNIKRASYLEQASIIGSIDNHIIESNIKHNYNEKNPKWRSPVIKGILAKTDIIIVPEAKKLIKGRNENDTEFILSTFQEALDYPGLINKQMKYSDFPITYESTTSIFATTYYIEEISELLLTQGFFQRIPTYKEEYTLNQVEDLRQDTILKLRKNIATGNFKELAKYYANIIKKLNNSEKHITFTEEAIKRLLKFNKDFFDNLRNISGQRLDILKSFSQTIIEMMMKIAGINCCIREDNEVIVQDINAAIPAFNAYISVLLNQLIVETNKQHKNQDLIIKKILEQHKKYAIEKSEFPSKTELIDYCKSAGLPFNKTQRTINTMINQNYFFIDKKRHNKNILLLNEGEI